MIAKSLFLSGFFVTESQILGSGRNRSSSYSNKAPKLILTPEEKLFVELGGDTPDLSVIRALIKGGVDAKARNTNNKDNTILHEIILCEGDISDIVEQLIRQGADINAQNKYKNTPLHYAVLVGNIEMVKFLVEHGANINITNKKEKTPLDLAEKEQNRTICDYLEEIIKNKEEIFKNLDRINVQELEKMNKAIKHNSPNVAKLSNEKGETLLHRMAGMGKLDVVAYLLKQGADINAQDDLGKTPIRWALEFQQFPVMEFLMSTDGIDMNKTDESGQTPLCYAVKHNLVNIVNFLIERGVDASVPNSKNGKTPLELAIENNKSSEIIKYLKSKTPLKNYPNKVLEEEKKSKRNEELARLTNGYPINEKQVLALIREGVDVDYPLDEYGETVLSWAIRQEENPNILECLLQHEYGVNSIINTYISDDDTPLRCAIKCNNLAAVEHLIAYGADVNQTDGFSSDTPLHFAVKKGKVDIVKCLIEHGADANAQSSGGNTPLHYAAEQGKVDIVKCLIRHKANVANVNAQNSEGNTPLHLAAEKGKVDVVECLIEHRANANARDSSGDTPLHRAIRKNAFNALAIVKCLYMYVYSIRLENTPLHCAVMQNKFDIVQFLVSRYADVNAQNAEGNTPLHCAVIQQNFNIVRYLLKEAGADRNIQNSLGNTPEALAVLKNNFEGDTPEKVAAAWKNADAILELF
ncbi:MAG: ankyrin repeat domain-containing protein [Puniceicoccales bacterium]|nr:ankyrin repeat domain-containing protein [Puniceicoccales bacterium]